MKRTHIVIISSYNKNQYFFSNDHCQDHGLGEDFVPVTHYLPARCVPREGIEDGIIDTVEKWLICCYSDMTEIENPDINFKPY